MPSEVRILPSPPGQPAVDRLNHSSFILSTLIDPFDPAPGALRVNPEQAPAFGLESRRVDFNKMSGMSCPPASGMEASKLSEDRTGSNLFEAEKRFSDRVLFLYQSGSSSVGRASAFQAEGRGFDPRFPLHFLGTKLLIRIPIYSASLSVLNGQVFSLFLAHVAQSVEHFLGKEEVIGSNPIVGSIKKLE